MPCILSSNLPDVTKLNLRKLKFYVIRFWLETVRCEGLSVFNCSHSTNNVSESYHSPLKAILRTHNRSVWPFLSHLKNVISDTDVDIRRLDESLPLQRKHKKSHDTNLRNRE